MYTFLKNKKSISFFGFVYNVDEVFHIVYDQKNSIVEILRKLREKNIWREKFSMEGYER